MSKKEEKMWDAKFIKIIKVLAPGTVLREGLENILRAKMGALVVIGDSPAVMSVVDGGFELDCEYTPSGFYELSKMDGAVVLSQDAKRILYANTQLIADVTVETSETGTRHRTAERVAKQTGALVISISQRRNIITVYMGNLRYVLKDITVILNKANQAITTLEKYKKVLEKGLISLSSLEFDDTVTLGDVVEVLIRAEQVNRIAKEIERYIIELGSEGRLISMQMEELLAGNDDEQLLIKDYCINIDSKTQETVREQIALLPEENLDYLNICKILGYNTTANILEIPVVPRGFRVLRKISRLPPGIVDNLVIHFKTLYRINNASLQDLDDVDGIGEVRAKTIKDGLKRIREQVLLERYI